MEKRIEISSSSYRNGSEVLIPIVRKHQPTKAEKNRVEEWQSKMSMGNSSILNAAHTACPYNRSSFPLILAAHFVLAWLRSRWAASQGTRSNKSLSLVSSIAQQMPVLVAFLRRTETKTIQKCSTFSSIVSSPTSCRCARPSLEILIRFAWASMEYIWGQQW